MLRSVAHDDRFLQNRLGRLHAKIRLGIEADHEAQVFGQDINYFHIENLSSSHLVIRTCLKFMRLYWRGCRNAAQIEVRHHYVSSPLKYAQAQHFERVQVDASLSRL